MVSCEEKDHQVIDVFRKNVLYALRSSAFLKDKKKHYHVLVGSSIQIYLKLSKMQ